MTRTPPECFFFGYTLTNSASGVANLRCLGTARHCSSVPRLPIFSFLLATMAEAKVTCEWDVSCLPKKCSRPSFLSLMAFNIFFLKVLVVPRAVSMRASFGARALP